MVWYGRVARGLRGWVCWMRCATGCWDGRLGQLRRAVDRATAQLTTASQKFYRPRPAKRLIDRDPLSLTRGGGRAVHVATLLRSDRTKAQQACSEEEGRGGGSLCPAQ